MKRTKDLESLEDVFVACRALGHWWEPTYTLVKKEGRTVILSSNLVCIRERAAKVPDPTQKDLRTYRAGKHRGQMIAAPRYDHADGYLLEKGATDGRGLARPAARAEYLDREVKARRSNGKRTNGGTKRR